MNEHYDNATLTSAGEKALVTLNPGKSGYNLNEVRVARYFQKIADSKTVVEPPSLLLTSASAKIDILRIYHQVKLCKVNILPPEEGWKTM